MSEYPCGRCDPPKYGHYYGFCDDCEKLKEYKASKEKLEESKDGLKVGIKQQVSRRKTERMRVIAFEGIDAAGKATQTELLTQSLRNAGYTVATVSFPRYDQPIGGLIAKYLAGEITLHPNAVHMLFEADRQDYMTCMEQLEEVFDFLVIDRYILSNLAFGVAKGLDIMWLRRLSMGVRIPDATFLLDVPPFASFKRKDKRDIHEKDATLLGKARTAYKALAYILSDTKGEDWFVYIVDGTEAVGSVSEEVNYVVDRVLLQNKQLWF